MVSMYLDGDIPKDIYLKKKDVLMRTTLALKDEKKDFEHERNIWVEPLREWILDTKQANFLSSSIDFKEISSFVKKVGTNPMVLDKSARFGAPVLSEFVFAYNTKTDFAHPLLPMAKAKNFHNLNDLPFCDSTGNRTPIARLRTLCPNR